MIYSSFFKSKKRGMSLVEILIVLAISTMILGIIYSMLSGSTKSKVSADVKSTLQEEGGTIQEQLVKIGTQCKEVTLIEDTSGAERSTMTYADFSLLPNTVLEIKKIVMTYANDTSYTLKLENGVLTLENPTINATALSPTVLAENVESVKIRPLDLNTQSNTSSTLSTANGIQFLIKLRISKGYSRDVTSDINVIVNFRNQNK